MKNVLIVDDNVSFTEFLDATVRAAGHTTRVVHNGAEAVDIWKDLRPDLVFLDVLLPKLDGFKVCQQIRAQENGGPPTPIVLMTGIYTKRTYQRDAINSYGANSYLVKPFTITDVWQHLDRFLVGEGAHEDRPGDAEQAADIIPDDETEVFGGASLRDRPLAAILADMRDRKRTGLLFLKSETATDVLFLDQGELVFARSNDTTNRLDRVLEDSGRLTGEQLEEAKNLFVESRGKTRMGQILVSLGYLDEDGLREAIQAQLRDRIHRAFQNQDLGFTFVEGPLPKEEDIRVHPDVDNLILEGVRVMPEETDFVRYLPPAETVLQRAGKAPGSLHLTGYEKQVLDLVNGKNTVAQILGIGRLAQIDVTRTLFTVIQLGLVQGPEAIGLAVYGDPCVESEAVALPATTEPEAEPDPETVRFELPRAGELGSVPAAMMLAELHRAAMTGVLEMEHDGVRKWIYLDKGDIVFAGSDEPRDRIGEVLVEGGILTQEQQESALGRLDDHPGKRLGQILVEDGVIDLEELQWAVVFQVQRIITSCLGWVEGTYKFREERLPTRENITVDLRTPDLLLEGLRRIPPETAEKVLRDTSRRLTPEEGSAEKVAEIRLTNQERDVWRALGTGASFDDLDRRRVADRATLAVSLHMFQALGLVSSPGAARKAAQAEEQPRAQEAPPVRAVSQAASQAAPQAPPRPRPAPPPAGENSLLQDLADDADDVFDEETARIAVDPAKGFAGDMVPRFLYEQLIVERSRLESTLLSTRKRLSLARDSVLEVERALNTLRNGLRTAGEEMDLERLDPILREMASICERSAGNLVPPNMRDNEHER